MAFNVHTLEIYDTSGIQSRAILDNTDHLGTRVNEQIESVDINDLTWTIHNAKLFCTLLTDRLADLKRVSFTIYNSYDSDRRWKPSSIIDGENLSTKCILNLIYFLVDHLQKLVSLHMAFISSAYSETPCFPHRIRRELHEKSLSRPYRLRCSSQMIQIWF